MVSYPRLSLANGSSAHLRACPPCQRDAARPLPRIKMPSAGAICNGRDAVAHATLGGSAAGPAYGGASGAAESWAPPAGLKAPDDRGIGAAALPFSSNGEAGFGGDPEGCRSTHTAGAEERRQNRECGTRTAKRRLTPPTRSHRLSHSRSRHGRISSAPACRAWTLSRGQVFAATPKP